MNSAQFITLAPVLAALALVLTPVSWAATIVALTAKREERAQRDLAREALTRAALAESALVDIRQRRSAATSRGNRTRAAAQRQLVLNTAAIMAKLRHYREDRDFMYGLDIRFLDAARARKG